MSERTSKVDQKFDNKSLICQDRSSESVLVSWVAQLYHSLAGINANQRKDSLLTRAGLRGLVSIKEFAANCSSLVWMGIKLD